MAKQCRPFTDSPCPSGLKERVEIPAHAKICPGGPQAFTDSVHHSLIQQHIPEADIRYEIFGPAGG